MDTHKAVQAARMGRTWLLVDGKEKIGAARARLPGQCGGKILRARSCREERATCATTGKILLVKREILLSKQDRISL